MLQRRFGNLLNMDDSKPFNALRELDRRSRDDHFTLMEELDGIKELERQIEAAKKENEEYERTIQEMKLETAKLCAKEKTDRAEIHRIRQRMSDELEPEIRRLAKKLEHLKATSAETQASNEQKRQYMIDLYENYKRDNCLNNPVYARYAALEEEDRRLADEVEAKEKIVIDQENLLKKLKEDENEKWEEFKGICIQAAKNWKANEEKKKLEKKKAAAAATEAELLARINNNYFAQPNSWFSNAVSKIPFMMGSMASTVNQPFPMMGPFALSNFSPYLPFSRPGASSVQDRLGFGGKNPFEELKLANAKCDEAMKTLREMNLKQTMVPSPPKKVRLSGSENTIHHQVKALSPNFIATSQATGVKEGTKNGQAELQLQPNNIMDETLVKGNDSEATLSAVNEGANAEAGLSSSDRVEIETLVDEDVGARAESTGSVPSICSSPSASVSVNASSDIGSRSRSHKEVIETVISKFAQPQEFRKTVKPPAPKSQYQKQKLTVPSALNRIGLVQPIQKNFPSFRMASQNSTVPASQESVVSNSSSLAAAATSNGRTKVQSILLGQSQDSNSHILEAPSQSGSIPSVSEHEFPWRSTDANNDKDGEMTGSFSFDGGPNFEFNFTGGMDDGETNMEFCFNMDGDAETTQSSFF